MCVGTLAKTGSNWTTTDSFYGVFFLRTNSWLILDSIQDGFDREREPQLKNALVSLMTRDGGRKCKLLAKLHLHVRGLKVRSPVTGKAICVEGLSSGSN